MPAPRATLDLRDQAACRAEQVDPELFFPAADDGPIYNAQVAAAKAVCGRCSVRLACLEEALARIPYGIAGGLTPEERRTHRTRSVATEAILDAGLRRDARADEVRAAGLALLMAGRPVREVATRCGVTERTAARWAANATSTSRTPAACGGTGKSRSAATAALPLISHPHALARTRAAEGHRS